MVSAPPEKKKRVRKSRAKAKVTVMPIAEPVAESATIQ
jgi:hypothetical protein